MSFKTALSFCQISNNLSYICFSSYSMSVIIAIVAAFTCPCKVETKFDADMKRIKCLMLFTLKSIFA